MNTPGDAALNENHDEDIWDAIAAFEKILEVLPTDRSSLETLSNAYQQIGDHARAREYTVRLADVLLNDGDVAAAQGLVDQLELYATDDDVIHALIDRIRGRGEGNSATAATDAAPAPVPADDRRAARSPSAAFSIAQEISMAWNLMQAGEIKQEDYAIVVEDLTEMSGEHGEQPVSTLHVLEAHSENKLDKIIEFLTGARGTPFISMDNFEFNLDTAQLLPLDFMIHRGAIVFESVGSDVLVAILNPYDESLREEVASITGRDCHFYIVLASEFDRRIERIKDSLVET